MKIYAIGSHPSILSRGAMSATVSSPTRQGPGCVTSLFSDGIAHSGYIDLPNLTEFWFSLYVSTGTTGTSNINNMLAFVNYSLTGDQTLFGLKSGSPATNWYATYRTAESPNDDQMFGLPFVNSTETAKRVDFHVKIHPTHGRFAMYVEGNLRAEILGNTKFRGVDTVSGIYLYRRSASSANAAYDTYFSGIIVADEDTRQYSFTQQQANTVGTTNEWIGNPSQVFTDVIPLTPLHATATDQLRTFKSSNPIYEFANSHISKIVHRVKFGTGMSKNSKELVGVIAPVGQTPTESYPFDLADADYTNNDVFLVSEVNTHTNTNFTPAELAGHEFGLYVREKE